MPYEVARGLGARASLPSVFVLMLVFASARSWPQDRQDLVVKLCERLQCSSVWPEGLQHLGRQRVHMMEKGSINVEECWALFESSAAGAIATCKRWSQGDPSQVGSLTAALAIYRAASLRKPPPETHALRSSENRYKARASLSLLTCVCLSDLHLHPCRHPGREKRSENNA